MDKEQKTIDPVSLPEGVLRNVVERQRRERTLNEFRTVELTLQETVKPTILWDEGVVSELELRIRTRYTTFRGDKGETRQTAYRSLTDCLYQDVLRDLRNVMQAIGDGKRREAMSLVNELYERLRP